MTSSSAEGFRGRCACFSRRLGARRGWGQLAGEPVLGRAPRKKLAPHSLPVSSLLFVDRNRRIQRSKKTKNRRNTKHQKKHMTDETQTIKTNTSMAGRKPRKTNDRRTAKKSPYRKPFCRSRGPFPDGRRDIRLGLGSETTSSCVCDLPWHQFGTMLLVSPCVSRAVGGGVRPLHDQGCVWSLGCTHGRHAQTSGHVMRAHIRRTQASGSSAAHPLRISRSHIPAVHPLHTDQRVIRCT